MALPQGDITVINQIEVYMSTTLSEQIKQEILPLYYGNATDTAIDDAIDEIGAARIVTYDPATITSGQKESTGINQIKAEFYTNYINSNSCVFHDGAVGKLIFNQANIYHFPATVDFEDVVDLCHLRMSYNYVDDYGTSGQKTTALGAYNTALNNLT